MIRAALILSLLPGMALAETVNLSVTFSEAARAKLVELGEQVVVNTAYYGEPSDAGMAHVDEMGQVSLGSEMLTIWPRDQVVQIGGITGGLPRDLVKAPYINVNIYSARYAHEDNLLICDLVEAPLEQASATPQAALCKLITE